MRLKPILFFTFMSGVLLLASCSRNNVTITHTNAKGEVPQLGNLVFRFSHSLVPDSLLQNWDSTDYISFEPRIPGRFRWDGPDELVFSPSQPLQPATRYTAKIKNATLRYSRFNNISKGDRISFHTPELSLDEALVAWVGETSTSAVPQLELYFNYPVDPEALKKKLQISIDGEKIAYNMVSASADDKISIRISGLKPEDRNYETDIVIESGLKPAAGNLATEEKIRLSTTIPSPQVLTVQSLASEHDGVEGVVKVTTSQQLTGDNIRTFIKVDPEIAFTIEPNDFGFTLRSDKFDTEKSYSLSISKGLQGRIGGTMKEDYAGGIAFGDLEAGISFTNSKAVYLSKKGSRNIEIQITNVPRVKVIVSKIYENNLLMAQRYGYYPQEKSSGPDYASYEDYEYYDSYGGGDAMLGDVVYEKEIDTRSLPKSNGGRLLNFAQFEDRLPEFNGVYHIMIRSTEDYWIRDSRYISLSDLGLITKEGRDRIYVFANSIRTAEPVNGATVTVYSANNQVVGTASTNKDGMAEIPYARKDVSGFRPAMVIAKTGDDFNYLPFHSTRVNTSRFDVGGKRINPSGFDAFVYAERDIYRPGEKINFSVIVRNEQWNSPGDVPLKMKVLLPDGKELRTFRKTLNEEGSVEGSIDIASAAITGSYTLEVYTSSDVLLATKSFSVEEFVPDRIRLNVKFGRDFLRPGDSSSLAVQALSFFGPPAANRNYETEIQVKHKYFSAKEFEEYDFSLSNQSTFFDKQLSEGKTDAEGKANILFAVPETYANMGVLQANFYTTVFDETGRPVSRAQAVDIFTQDAFFGIKRDWFYYFPLNQPVTFQFAAANREGKGTSAKAKVEVIKHEYRTVLTKSGSYFRYESQKEDKILVDQEMAIGSKTSFVFVPRTPGDYEVRLYQPGANSYVSRSFYSYGGFGSSNNSFEVNTEGNIDISIDKKSYLSGEKVKAHFKTPFSGQMLVTLETDHVISYQYVKVEKRDATLDLKVSGEHVPNFYITATLIKPHEMTDMPLTVAHGFRNVTVEDKDRKMKVELTAQKSVRSKTHQKVSVKAAPGSYVTLSAVDNGVLQITDFKTPDPYDHFYQKRALDVSAFDLYPLLFAELRARRSSTGGDGADMSLEKRVNPMPAKRIKVASYWGGIKKANSSGVAEFEFDIPQFSGEMRLMAVAYKGQSFGAADQPMTVADPIVISTALPRFLSPGDTVNVPVTITNTTTNPANITASINLAGPMKVVGGNNQSLQVSAKGEGRAQFWIVADPVINVGTVSITVNGLGEKFTDATEIAVRPPSTLQQVTGAGSITGGSTQKISIGLGDFIPGSTNYNLVVSRSPVLELGEQLRYLIQYPYGCTEQTVSAAFPQLYYGDLAELVGKPGGKAALSSSNANINIMEAIRKIRMRQLYNGAVMMWDGEGTENWWTTVYAAHFLLEAKKAGFDVDNSLIETMLNYINNRLRSKETITYYYNRTMNKKIAPKEVAYGLYVLALAGRPNVPAMNYYKANPLILALDSRYLLAAAYAKAGDRKAFSAMLPSSFSGEESVPQTGGSFYSNVRDEAIALNALMDVDPGNAQVGTMVKHVADKLKSRTWLNTQERVFSFLALGKHARAANNSTVTAEIRSNGKMIAKVEGGEWRGDAKALGSGNIDIVTKGSGRMYYFWQAEGISASGAYKEEDSYLKVRRTFYDRKGTPLTSNTFKQNDLIIIGITLDRMYSTPVENIVITDLLPAGFEIENPRTKEIPGMDWIKDAATPVALDVRDDRIHFFVDANNNKQTYYYAVRAVSPGMFKIGPVSADAMYNGEYHSYHGAGMVRVGQ